MSDPELLKIKDLSKSFALGGGLLAKPRAWIRAVDGVSFSVSRGENFGLVGESGCGKTTLGRLILRLIHPTSGRIYFDGDEITTLSRTAMRPFRSRMQIIFQDPYSSLDPRMKVESIITEPLRTNPQLSKIQRREIASDLLGKVGLKSDDLAKYPHEFSGGQRQRIGIARALCVRPDLIVADEPVSALDVSIQAQVINLMQNLKDEFRLSYIFISHDLSVIHHVCDRIAVMYFGTIVELAPTQMFRRSPRHPYTEALLQAIPLPDPHRKTRPILMEGDVPNPLEPPTGCAFHPRCRYAFDRCREQTPPLIEAASNHLVACWLNQSSGLKY
jgi:oligopeptide/dipeptide ABC transporter ATP-binding protein